MISIADVDDLFKKNSQLIDSSGKKDTIYMLGEELKKAIRRHTMLADAIDNGQTPIGNLGEDMKTLSEQEKKINALEVELKKNLMIDAPSRLIRDTTQQGGIVGNGFVVHRTNGSKFFIPKGTLTQEEIEGKKKVVR